MRSPCGAPFPSRRPSADSSPASPLVAPARAAGMRAADPRLERGRSRRVSAFLERRWSTSLACQGRMSTSLIRDNSTSSAPVRGRQCQTPDRGRRKASGPCFRNLSRDIRRRAKCGAHRLIHWNSIGSTNTFMFPICLRVPIFPGSFGAKREEMLIVDQMLYRSTDRVRTTNRAMRSRR